jgi:hypothetical protein
MSALNKFLKRCAVRAGRTLIVGSKIHDGTGKPDRRKLYDEAIGVDMQPGDGVDLVLDLEESAPPGVFAHIECTSVLEHSRRPWLLCANLERVLIDGGTILVMTPWVWREHGYPDDYFRYTPSAIKSLLPSVRWDAQSFIIEDELANEVPKMWHGGKRWMARSELIMFGRKHAL